MKPDVVDLAIIGGGVQGCAVAWRLAQRGLRPVVVERGVPGAEASSAAAGMLVPEQECDEPGPMLELCRASHARYPAFVRELEAASGVSVGLRQSGVLALARTEEDEAAQRRKARWQAERGLRVERLDRDDVARLEPALAPCRSALRFPDGAQLEPPRLMRALRAAATRAGVEFRVGQVRRVLIDERRVVGLDVDGERLPVGRALLAAGSWSSLVEGTGLPAGAIHPVRGQLLELQGSPTLLSHVVFGGGYLVPRSDGRIVVGSTMERVGFRRGETAEAVARLLRFAVESAPALAEAQLVRAWSSFRPATDDHLPLLGSTPLRGLHLATGHFRNGILLAPITADVLAAQLCDEPPPVDCDLRPFSIARLLR